jgi:hypothetical protein
VHRCSLISCVAHHVYCRAMDSADSNKRCIWWCSCQSAWQGISRGDPSARFQLSESLHSLAAALDSGACSGTAGLHCQYHSLSRWQL